MGLTTLLSTLVLSFRAGQLAPTALDAACTRAVRSIAVNVATDTSRQSARQVGSTAPVLALPSWGTVALRLVLPRPVPIYLGEPIIIVAILENNSDSERQMFGLDPESGFLTVFVRGPGAVAERPYLPPTRRERPRAQTLLPHTSIASWIHLYYDHGGWAMSNHGRYSVRARLAIGPDVLESSAVNFDVVVPLSQRDRAASQLMINREVAAVLYEEGGNYTEAWLRLDELRVKYKQSRYAAYADFAFGVVEARHRYVSKGFRPADCDAAKADLRASLERLRDPIFAARATIALFRCLPYDERRKALREYMGRFPAAASMPGVADELERAIREHPSGE